MTLISIFILLSLDANGASSLSQPIKRTDLLYDPVFGVEYRPSEVHFEKAPAVIYQCKDLDPERRELFLFGKVVKGGRTFYLVDGWLEAEEDEETNGYRHFEAEDDEGIIVVISSEVCHDIGAGYAWNSNTKYRKMAEAIGITEEITLLLIDDAIGREIQAFGGKAELLRRIDATVAANGWSLSLLIQDRLDKLRKGAGHDK
jgi:hypothetical protein